MVFRLKFEGDVDQSFMVLADTYHTTSDILYSIWATSLESDILQVAHHGIWPAKKEFYDFIKEFLLLIQNFPIF